MTETPKEETAAKTSRNYKIYCAIVFAIAHVILVIFILTWSLHKAAFSYSGGNFILFMMELPGVLIAKIFGLAGNLESALPFIIAFILNTIAYAAIGYGLGAFFQKRNWIEEIQDLLLTEEEIWAKEEKRK